MKTIIQIGLKRSGNHGIINLFKHAYALNNIVHLNDISIFSYELYKKYSQIEINKREKNNEWSGFKNAELVIISLENKDIAETLIELKKFYHLEDFHIIILLRNPYNNASSTYKYLLEIQCRDRNKLVNWLMKEWVKYAKFLLFHQIGGCITPIIYDKFYQNKDYREDVFRILEINYKEEYLNDISGWGISFFNKDCKDASKMDTFTRYLMFQNNPYFINYIFKNKRLFDLWDAICDKFNFKIDPLLVIILKKYL